MVPIRTKLDTNDVWKILYKKSSFHFDWTRNTQKQIILVKVFFQDFVLIDWKSGLKYTV